MQKGWLYPFDVPDRGYMLDGGAVRSARDADIKGRIPVLAIGSNAAPQRLRAKFDDDVTLPVLPHPITGWAIVYSSHVSSYGAIPATLYRCDHAQSSVFATWLTDEQLTIMDESEGLGVAYERITVAPDGRDVFAYRSLAGAFAHRGMPVRLAEIATTGATPLKMLQAAMLGMIAGLTGNGNCGRRFSERIATDAKFRDQVNAALAMSAIKPDETI